MDEHEKKILIVDDDEDHLVLIQTLVQEMDDIRATTDTASSYDEALSRFDAGLYDICLLDYKLGERDGLDLLHAVRATGATTPIIFLTSRGDERVAVEAMKAGATDYLRKENLSPESLGASCRYALELHREETLREQAEAALRKAKDELEIRVEERTAELARANEQLVAEVAERKRVESSLRRRNVVLEALGELSKDIFSTPELDLALEAVARLTGQALDVTSAYISDWNEEQGTLKVVAEYYGPEASDLERVSDLGVVYNLEENFADAGEWLRTWDRCWVQQVDDSELNPKEHAHLEQYGAKSVLGVPLAAEGKPIGYIELWESRRKRDFTREETEIVQAIARQVSMAIHNARLYQSLQTAYQELQEADHLKVELIQNISHEFRTPLSQLVGYMGLMRDETQGMGTLSDEQRQALEIMAREGEKLTWLVENFVAIHSMEKALRKRANTDIAALVEDIIRSTRLRADERQIRLTLQADENLPPVIISRMAIIQVLDNLLSNALKFAPPDSEVVVAAELNPLDGKVHVSVADTGSGIPEEEHKRIFERFYQVDGTTTRESGGLGLGLAVCKEIVEAHGGTIWVEGTPGAGATFIFALPTQA